jgi:D-xylose transport system permease protein
MGGNEEAARLSGINIYRMKLIIYAVITALSALSGIPGGLEPSPEP